MQVGAEDEVLGTDSEGGIHAEMKIGDSTLMMGGGAVPRRALEASAESLAEPAAQPAPPLSRARAATTGALSRLKNGRRKAQLHRRVIRIGRC